MGATLVRPPVLDINRYVVIDLRENVILCYSFCIICNSVHSPYL
jgi:hypothetical protein